MGNSQAKEETTNQPASNHKSSSPTKSKPCYRHQNKMASARKKISLGKEDVEVNVIKGDLTTEKADVVVCTANKNLDLKKGRASAVLLEAGGNALQEECSSKYSEGIDHGDIAVVTGGRLACKKVYFVSLPLWSGHASDAHKQKLFDLVKNCLLEADRHECQSIALPALGTGFLKYPADVVAQTTFRAIEDFSNNSSSITLKTVSVIVYYKDVSAYQAFENEAKLRASGTKKKITKDVGKKKSTPFGAMSFQSIMSGKSLLNGNSIGEIRINISHGKLAVFKADVLVNSTTNDLQLNNGGLSESLLEKAGDELQLECYDRYPDGIDPGDIAVTSGYNLRCIKVYHGSLPEWDKDKSYNSKKKLQRFVTNCLNQIEKDGLRTIAFPALGTGYLNYPAKVSAETIIECVMQHERNHPDTNLVDINIVVYDEMDDWRTIMKVYEDELDNQRSKASESVQAGNDFQFKLMENVLKNALERGAESSTERGTKEWFKLMYKSETRPPKSWTNYHGNKSLKDWIMDCDDIKPVVVKVDTDTLTAITRLVHDTWESKYIGQGRDAQGLGSLNYTKVRILKVERIENCKIFEKYAQKRQELFFKASKEGSFIDMEKIANSSGAIKTSMSPRYGKALSEDIYPEINEYFMFHGTKESVVDGIVKQGLDSRLSGMSAMFGQGVYGAESSTKADQYADDRSNRTDGRKKMFLTRMCLGKICVLSQPQAFARAPCCSCIQDKCSCENDEFFDAVVGDGKWNFREFVVYDRTQVYPEYIITYVRE